MQKIRLWSSRTSLFIFSKRKFNSSDYCGNTSIQPSPEETSTQKFIFRTFLFRCFRQKFQLSRLLSACFNKKSISAVYCWIFHIENSTQKFIFNLVLKIPINIAPTEKSTQNLIVNQAQHKTSREFNSTVFYQLGSAENLS